VKRIVNGFAGIREPSVAANDQRDIGWHSSPPRQQFHGGNSEGSRDIVQGGESDIAFPALDGANVGSMQTAFFSAIFLRPFPFVTKPSQIFCDDAGGVVTSHGRVMPE